MLLEDTRASLLTPLPASLASPLRLGADRVTVSTCSEWLARDEKGKQNFLPLENTLIIESVPRKDNFPLIHHKPEFQLFFESASTLRKGWKQRVCEECDLTEGAR